MTRTNANLIREHLESLKGWIKHWETDRFCNLVPTESSLLYGKHHADSALALLDRMEAETKEPA
jgi:hypothetical protein